MMTPPNRIVTRLGIYILVLFSFRGLISTPLEEVGYSFEFVLECLVVIFTFIYFLDLAIKKRLELYHVLGVVLCIVPFIVALAAKDEFGQPFLYGLLAQRDYFLILTGYLIYYLLETRVINLSLLENYFVELAWISLIVFFLFKILINPEHYLELKSGVVGFKELKGGYVYRFQMTFIAFGAIYYTVKGIRSGKLIPFLCAGIFVYYIIFVRQERTTTLFLFITLAVIFLNELSLRRKLLSFVIGSSSIIAIAIYLYVLNFKGLDQIGKLYYQSFVILTGESSSGEKLDVRWYELDIALKYIRENLFWGSGELSKQWNNGYRQLGYFFPSDLGLFGTVFVYGVFGTLIVYSQAIYAFFVNKRTMLKDNTFVISVKYAAFMYYIDSLSDASIAQRAAIGMTYVAIMYFYFKSSKEKAI